MHPITLHYFFYVSPVASFLVSLQPSFTGGFLLPDNRNVLTLFLSTPLLLCSFLREDLYPSPYFSNPEKRSTYGPFSPILIRRCLFFFSLVRSVWISFSCQFIFAGRVLTGLVFSLHLFTVLCYRKYSFFAWDPPLPPFT